MYWFENTTITHQLPFSLRCYASYCRGMVNPSTGLVRGGSFLLNAMRRCRESMSGPATVPITVDGLTIYLDPFADRIFFAFEELLHGGDEGRIMRLALKEGDTFLDVGANHGTYSLLARTIVGPAGAVHAFEPQPHLAKLMSSSFAANQFRNCIAHQIALSDREGEASFFIPVNSGLAGLHRGFSAGSGHRQIEVRLARFDDEVQWKELPGNLFIKLDIEGNELPFLRGARNMIHARHPLILLEINPTAGAAAGYPIKELVSQLDSLGYTAFAEMDSYPQRIPLTNLTGERLEQFRDIVVLP